jgi:hypothetical protein
MNRTIDSAEHKAKACEHGVKEVAHGAKGDAHWEAAKNPNLSAGTRINQAGQAASEKMKEGAEALGRNYENMRS